MRSPQYVGFWYRVLAASLDSVLYSALSFGFIYTAYGWEYFIPGGVGEGPVYPILWWVLPALLTLLFWEYQQATPGKMAISAKIVDAETGGVPSAQQWLLRYVGYFLSALPLCLGYLWVAFDRRKQGWHDKLAGTMVIFSE